MIPYNLSYRRPFRRMFFMFSADWELVELALCPEPMQIEKLSTVCIVEAPSSSNSEHVFSG